MGEKTLIMKFITDKGTKASLRLSGIKEEIKDSEISTLMDLIISKNIFNINGAFLKLKDGAQIEERNVENIVLA